MARNYMYNYFYNKYYLRLCCYTITLHLIKYMCMQIEVFSTKRTVINVIQTFFLCEHNYSEVRLFKSILICSVVQHEQLILIEFWKWQHAAKAVSAHHVLQRPCVKIGCCCHFKCFC